MKINFLVNHNYVESVLRFLSVSFPEFIFEFVANQLEVTPEPDERQIIEMKEIIRVVEFSERLRCDPTLYQNDPGHTFYSGNTQSDLESTEEVKWIKDGLVIYQGSYLAVKKKIEAMWANVSLNKFDAHEIENPGLWSMEIFHKTGYLQDFPHEALFVVGAKRSSASLANLSDKLIGDALDVEQSDVALIADDLQLIGGCQPSVCTSCYFALESFKNYKNRVYTTFNRVFRNEGGRDLSRLTSFTVRDIMAVGEESFVLEKRNDFLEAGHEFVKKLGLKFKIEAANDPFFSRKLKKISFQNSGALKYEIQVFIPYTQSWLAVGSVNYHLTNFGDAFDIFLEGGGAASSCCIGIGFDRLVYALFSQFGPDINSWPVNIFKDELF